MAEIGFIELPDNGAILPAAELFDVPLTAERSSDGRKRRALADAGYDFSPPQYRFRHWREGNVIWTGWLVDEAIVRKAAQKLRENGEALIALQLERALEEAEKT